MCVYSCMCVCLLVCVFMRACMCVHHACVCSCMCARVYLCCVPVCVLMCVPLRVMCACICVHHACVCVHACACVCLHMCAAITILASESSTPTSPQAKDPESELDVPGTPCGRLWLEHWVLERKALPGRAGHWVPPAPLPMSPKAGGSCCCSEPRARAGPRQTRPSSLHTRQKMSRVSQDRRVGLN